MPKHTNKEYFFEKQPITVFNIVKYLAYLETHGIIPKFEFHNDDSNLYFEIYYIGYNKWRKHGISLITYNIYTKKWKSIIDHASYRDLYEKYYYLIENDMIKVKYTSPYVEYELESEYIEDILEPSLNIFDNKYINNYNIQFNIIPNNVIIDDNFVINKVNNTLYMLAMDYSNNYYHKLQNILIFNNNFIKHEKYLNFEAIKKIYTDNYLILPLEIWNNIYLFYI